MAVAGHQGSPIQGSPNEVRRYRSALFSLGWGCGGLLLACYFGMSETGLISRFSFYVRDNNSKPLNPVPKPPKPHTGAQQWPCTLLGRSSFRSSALSVEA